MNKVVKCKNGKCGQHFMHTEKDTKCPFCKTEYGEVDPVRSREGSQRASASNGVEEKTQEKEGTTSTKKGAFKIKIIKNKDS